MEDFNTGSMFLSGLYSFAVTTGWIGLGFLALMIGVIVIEEWKGKEARR